MPIAVTSVGGDTVNFPQNWAEFLAVWPLDDLTTDQLRFWAAFDFPDVSSAMLANAHAWNLIVTNADYRNLTLGQKLKLERVVRQLAVPPQPLG